MPGEAPIAALNAGYVCPAESGPAWRKAAADGVDLSLVERSLAMSPWERLCDHDKALALRLMLRAAGRKLWPVPRIGSP